METLSGRSALVTGASRGLGRDIAGALASEGMDVALAARSAGPLGELAAALESATGVRAVPVPADLTDRAQVRAVARAAEEELGGVDLLVNNAGVTNAFPYHLRDPAEIERGVELNLLAPMLLTRHVLPGMVERGRGHVVNMASLAGKAGPPYEEVYGATKAGLIGFTQSLRREYHGTGVGASVICPGYVSESGMYADSVEETGVEAPRRVGRTTPDDVARAVIRAVRRDVPEIIVNSTPVRPLVVLSEAAPRLGEWIGRKLDLFRAFEQRVEKAMQEGTGGPGADGPGA